MTDSAAFAALHAENARLIALLESHGIEWRQPQSQPLSVVRARPGSPGNQFSTEEKVALFRRLFRERTDVYPVRWEGKTSGKTGYSPACANEWLAGVCLPKATDQMWRSRQPNADAAVRCGDLRPPEGRQTPTHCKSGWCATASSCCFCRRTALSSTSSKPCGSRPSTTGARSPLGPSKTCSRRCRRFLVALALNLNSVTRDYL